MLARPWPHPTESWSALGLRCVPRLAVSLSVGTSIESGRMLRARVVRASTSPAGVCAGRWPHPTQRNTSDMNSLIQDTPAYKLSIDILPTPWGHSVRFVSFVPTANRPEEQTKFQGNFTIQELQALHTALGEALKAAGCARNT
jgi:hypothetical protein